MRCPSVLNKLLGISFNWAIRRGQHAGNSGPDHAAEPRVTSNFRQSTADNWNRSDNGLGASYAVALMAWFR